MKQMIWKMKKQVNTIPDLDLRSLLLKTTKDFWLQIIGKRKATIDCNFNFHSRIEQEEAKYENLKKSLVVQQFCPETLPRPNVKKRKSKIQTIGLPKIFGGSLDDYYEATGDKIPLVIESCIRTINLFGMRHQGIFRVTGSHVRKYRQTIFT